ncbi:NUDIX hydrolase [Metabacillus bambusae]|uniref:NUDIX domain-containing protein n=1 Tax=Metabacillus bambusae TaxID=2795218 RepID=A0ABS3N764_9BACI|nr:NUDIX domain-containing protein [Metabacillus bambusae]MBO1513911.1 NUDIX domain-containing protein [Metabacillus bambusae]
MEQWDLYDKNRNKTNRTHKRGNQLKGGYYHIVVHVWIRNNKGEILLTKRHPDKTHPNLWECTGGSILAGEESLEGALREVKEEIGISLLRSNGGLVKSERRDKYNNFCDIWLFDQSFDLSATELQQDEVSDIKWVTSSELDSIYNSNMLVPTLSYYKEIL